MPSSPEFGRDWWFGPADAAALSRVDIPHTAPDLGWCDWDPAGWERRWRYRKDFEVTPEAGTRYFLRFGGALTRAEPVLNGHPLPAHAGGYLPFQHEVTGLLRRHNVLDVLLDGSFDPGVPPNHGLGRPSTAVDFWQPAGLYREVELIVLPQEHIADVFARPFSVLERPGLDMRCEIDLARAVAGPRLTAELRRDGRVVDAASRPLPQLGPGRHAVALRMPGLDGIALWDTDDPVLYDVVVALSAGATPIHEHRVRTGFREARFDRSGFHLNGERRQLFGVNRHQFFPFAGGAMPERVQRRDAEILREELSCTMVRCSHYPQHEGFLAACDELGLLVWDEPPGWQHLGDEQWLALARRDVHDMIVRDRNHPSVVLWGVRLNETPGHSAHYTRMQELARSLDGSRQTAGALHPADHDTTDFQQDVFGYNDYTPSGLAPPRTDFPYVVSEAVGTLSGPARFYRRTDPQDVQQGQALAHAREEFPRLPHPPFFADFSTVDTAVELRIDGYLDGRHVLTRRFCADRSRDRLALRLDDTALRSNGADATRAELLAVDAYGSIRPWISGAVTLELSGPAALVGRNPFPLAETGGAGAVWLRTTGGIGTVLLRAHHPQLGSAEARLQVGP